MNAGRESNIILQFHATEQSMGKQSVALHLVRFPTLGTQSRSRNLTTHHQDI